MFSLFPLITKATTYSFEPKEYYKEEAEGPFMFIALSKNDVIGSINGSQFLGNTNYLAVMSRENGVINLNSTTDNDLEFDYFIYPDPICDAYEIILNPKNNYQFLFTANGELGLKMLHNKRFCFYFAWDSSYEYQIDLITHDLDINDHFKYSLDADTIPDTIVQKNITLKPTNNTAVIFFETDSYNISGKALINVRAANSVEQVKLNKENILFINDAYFSTLTDFANYLISLSNLKEFNRINLAIYGLIAFIVLMLVYYILLLILRCKIKKYEKEHPESAEPMSENENSDHIGEEV